jgi:hypothetical protein
VLPCPADHRCPAGARNASTAGRAAAPARHAAASARAGSAAPTGDATRAGSPARLAADGRATCVPAAGRAALGRPRRAALGRRAAPGAPVEVRVAGGGAPDGEGRREDQNLPRLDGPAERA